LVVRLDKAGFAVASGAACSSVNPGRSHVLEAMAVPDVELKRSTHKPQRQLEGSLDMNKKSRA